MKFLLDTDLFSVAAREGSTALRQRLDMIPAHDIGLSVITAGEIEFGLAKNRPARWLAERIEVLRRSFATLAFGDDVPLRYGQLRAHLYGQGTPIGPNDCWIAAHALSEDLTLLTGNDREFRRVPGLRVENWLR